MFYIFHGDDAFSQREELASLRERMGGDIAADLNTTQLDGRSVSFSELARHCSTIPFLADRRVVIVTGLLERLDQKRRSPGDTRLLNDLLDYLPTLPSTTRLILLETVQLPRNHPVLALAQDSAEGHVKAFATPKGSALVRWVQSRAHDAGGDIESSAAQALCSFVGDNPQLLSQEIEKLVAYTGSARSIRTEDVSLLTPDARQASVFDMVDALGKRDVKTASRTFQDLLTAGDHPLALLGMVTRQYRLMIQVKELAPSLHTAEAIARHLRQNPYPIRKLLGQSRNYSMDQLRALYHRLVETDADIKTGKLDATLAIDALIANLGSARDTYGSHRRPQS
jgi:DNA polymerase-3 subunit delta